MYEDLHLVLAQTAPHTFHPPSSLFPSLSLLPQAKRREEEGRRVRERAEREAEQRRRRRERRARREDKTRARARQHSELQCQSGRQEVWLMPGQEGVGEGERREEGRVAEEGGG